MSDLLTIRGFLEEAIPALSAAGLSNSAIRDLSRQTVERIGAGGRTREWILTFAAVVADTGNERAVKAFALAFDVWAKPVPA